MTHAVRRLAVGCAWRTAARPTELPEAEVEPVPPATLSVEGLTVRFGSVVAVDDVSFEVRPGEVVGPHRAQRRRQDDGHRRRHRLREPAAGTISLDGQRSSG